MKKIIKIVAKKVKNYWQERFKFLVDRWAGINCSLPIKIRKTFLNG